MTNDKLFCSQVVALTEVGYTTVLFLIVSDSKQEFGGNKLLVLDITTR